MNQNFQILGTGSYLPGKGVSAAEIEQRTGLETGWIDQHTAVKTRYECVAPDSLRSMAKKAIERCLENAKTDWNQIDLVIDCSTSLHQPIPCNAATILSLFGDATANATGFDVHGTCLGFLLGLNVANSLLAHGQYQRILLVASEATLKAANWKEPESASLLGDGAAAMLIGRSTPRDGFLFEHETFSEHYNECSVRGGGHELPVFEYSDENQDCYKFQMSGPKLFRTAMNRLPAMVKRMMERMEDDVQELLVIPHQASPKAVELIRRRLGYSEDQFINVAADYGNMAAASISFVIDHLRRNQMCQQNDQVLLLGTSAGYSQAGLIFQI